MKTTFNIILFILLTGLLSCSGGRPSETDIVGKWWTYKPPANEYVEYDIDANTIGIFMYPAGDGGVSNYELSGDTLHFRGLSFRIKMLSKDRFTLSFFDKTDTLRRLPDTVVTFHSVPDMNDSAYNVFYKAFKQRALQAGLK